jgi:type IV pilus assembly protein PilB
MSFLEALAQKGTIRPGDVPVLEREAKESGKSMEDVLVTRGLSKEEILEVKGEYYQLPTRSINGLDIPFETLNYIPEQSARHYKFIPLSVEEGALDVGIVDPDDLEAKDALQFIATKIGMPFRLFLISEKDFAETIKSYKGLSGEVTKALTDLETELSVEGVSETKQNENKEKSSKITEDAPVTKIVATMLRYAIEGSASDIHVEPTEDNVRVRFRVDGVMHTSLRLPLNVHQAVVARVKILANMKLDEKRKPQDNRFSAHINGRKIDFRVSTFPTYYGEKVVMRVLDSEKGVIPLDKLNLSERSLKAVKNAIKKPYGLILISGPTGSGKTTTLYSMINEIDKDTKNVLSLEDPVEYNISGMNQSQVRPEIGYTFASGLRTTLRQDPDVIMVGEIRDKETAGLAVQAALTGHLVLSTIHTNNVVGIIPRLIDMGVDPYLIAPTLVLGIAQRLVKTMCPGTGEPLEVTGSLKEMIDKEFSSIPDKFRKDLPIKDVVYKVHPTPECPTGTKGRTAVFEVMEMDGEMEKILLNNPKEGALMGAALANGMLTMRQDAMLKAFEGRISIEEVNTLGVQYELDVAEQKQEQKVETPKEHAL